MNNENTFCFDSTGRIECVPIELSFCRKCGKCKSLLMTFYKSTNIENAIDYMALVKPSCSYGYTYGFEFSDESFFDPDSSCMILPMMTKSEFESLKKLSDEFKEKKMRKDLKNGFLLKRKEETEDEFIKSNVKFEYNYPISMLEELKSRGLRCTSRCEFFSEQLIRHLNK